MGAEDKKLTQVRTDSPAVAQSDSDLIYIVQGGLQKGSNLVELLDRVQNITSTLDISGGGTIDLDTADGFSSTARVQTILLTGTISTDTLLPAPALDKDQDLYVVDVDGNGTSAPEFKLEIGTTGGDGITEQSSDGTSNVYEILNDNESVHLRGDLATTKWNALSVGHSLWARGQDNVLHPVLSGDLEIGALPEESASVAANFTALGANLTLDTDHIQNNLITSSTEHNDSNKSTDATTPFTISADVDSSGAAWQAYDGSVGTQWATDASALPHWWKLDAGSPITFSQYRFNGNGTLVPKDFTIEGSATGSFSGEETVIDTVTGNTAGQSTFTSNFTISSPGSFRYYRMNVSANVAASNQVALLEIEFFEQVAASDTNTALTTQLVASGTINYDPASLVILDENDAALGTGQCNVSYDINGAGQTSLVDIVTFRALDVSLFAAADLGSGGLILRVQPVGLDSIKRVAIFNTSTTFKMKQSGQFQILENSVVKFDTSGGDLDLAAGLGLHGVTAPAQAAKINDAAGGATVDAEARTAIASLIDAIEGVGIATDT